MKFTSERDTEEMLKKAGVKNISELFTSVKPILGRKLDLPASLSELDLKRHMEALSDKNRPVRCFIGGGAYDHYIPSAVDHIVSRSEFYTAYTPYQAEVSQGTLQVMYEFQTYLCMLTGMDTANASMYDGATTLAESVFLACNDTGRDEVAVMNTVNPYYLEVLKTYCEGHGIKINDKLDDKSACAIVQNPDYEGSVHDIQEYAKMTHAAGALLIVSVVEPTSLTLLEPPGKCGADIVAGEAQSFGNPMSFGGPMLGYMAVKKELMKRIPGRLSGMTVDGNGRRGFVLTLQAREQHIRRERASSNICSNEALSVLAATVYLSLLGKPGLRSVSRLSYQRAHELQQRLSDLGFKLENKYPFYNEFTVKCPVKPGIIIDSLAEKGIGAGINIGDDRMLICCTEKITQKDIDDYTKAVEVLL